MPYLPDVRQYRSFKASNFQPITRDGEENGPSYRVKGYWTTFNTEYCLYEATKYWPAEYEQIDSHALDEADMSDVIFQENHEGSPLSRQRNGSLELGVDSHGAWCIADLGGCQRGRDLYESITNGLIDEMSFGFIIDSNEDSDGFTSFKDENGDYHTTITRIKRVYDVSAVSIPANPTTEISEMRKRSYISHLTEADMERRKAELEEAERAAKEQHEAHVQEPAEDEAVEPDEGQHEENQSKEQSDEEQLRARKRRMRRARAMQLSSI